MHLVEKVSSTNNLIGQIKSVNKYSVFRLAKSPDFLTFLRIKILLNSGADFKDFLLISPDFRNFEEF